MVEKTYSALVSERSNDKQPRDYQRSKCYVAEDVLKPRRKWLHDLARVRSLVLLIESHPWWSEHHYFMDAPIEVKDGRGLKGPVSYDDLPVIAIPRRFRNDWIVCHEMAHQMVDPWQHAGHGPQWAGKYLELVRGVMGEAARGELLDSFLAAGVDIEFVQFDWAYEVPE